jgi:hypothetical protein
LLFIAFNNKRVLGIELKEPYTLKTLCHQSGKGISLELFILNMGNNFSCLLTVIKIKIRKMKWREFGRFHT